MKTCATIAQALAFPALIAAGTPAMAAPISHGSSLATMGGIAPASAHDRWDGYDRDGRYDRAYGRGYRDEPVHRNTRVWRGNDGRTYCRRGDGTTGLLIGGAVGGVLGHGLVGRGDRTLGTILGLAGGALLGREIDRSNSRCR